MSVLSPTDAATERELRLAYLSRLPGRLQAIEEAWSRFARDREAAAFEPLKMLVHRLAGSAATYGFVDVSAKARELDHLTQPAVAIAPFTEGLSSLRDAVDRLLAEDESVSRE